jgi:hypothetical protein
MPNRVCAKNAIINLLMHVHNNAWITNLLWRILTIYFMMIVELDGGHMNWGDGLCGLKVGKNKKKWARTKFEATKKCTITNALIVRIWRWLVIDGVKH